MKESVFFGGDKLKIEDINAIAFHEKKAELNHQASFKEKINCGANYLDTLISEGAQIYGVTTGFGDSCTESVDASVIEDLPYRLIRFHTCGMGNYFSANQSLAIMAVRLGSLSMGLSGVTYGLIERLTMMINHGLAPRIPQEGSVGASGDLTPLSYIAASLIGLGEVEYQGNIRPTADVFSELGWQPLKLRPKEALAIMNGTSVMAALACQAYRRAEYLTRLAARITSLACIGIKGNSFHFEEQLFNAKPHEGQNRIAKWIRSDFSKNSSSVNPLRLQDRYSLRCAPHVIGVLEDALPFFRQLIETELNSVTDNPIVDPVNKKVFHGGHFYGGHMAFVMDSMKSLVAYVAVIIDLQIALLFYPKFYNVLPANLSAEVDKKSIQHGFKGVQIGASAWTAEALKLTMPASVFSRSTECHNQDKVSMGTIAARDCLRILELTEQVAAAGVLCSVQALEIRRRRNEILEADVSSSHKEFCSEVLKNFDIHMNEVPLEVSLRQFTQFIRDEKWELY